MDSVAGRLSDGILEGDNVRPFVGSPKPSKDGLHYFVFGEVPLLVAIVATTVSTTIAINGGIDTHHYIWWGHTTGMARTNRKKRMTNRKWMVV